MLLSEAMHGRAGAIEASRWEAFGLNGPPPPEADKLLEVVQQAQRLALVQIMGLLAMVARGEGVKGLESVVLRNISRPGPPMILRSGPANHMLVAPVTYDSLDSPILVGLHAQAEQYWEDLRRGPEAALAAVTLSERRARAWTCAAVGYELERQQLGPELGGVHARLGPVILTAEMAGMGSRWLRGAVGDQFAMASTTLRTAYFLWLEDDWAAMAALRACVEATAKARTLRLKPERASKLSAQPNGGSPIRWIEAAGLRRLTALNRFLGEFAHISPVSRPGGAFAGLIALEGGDDERAFKRARGHALDAVALLLENETQEAIDSADAEVAAAFASVSRALYSQSPQTFLNELLDRSQDLRGHELGEPIGGSGLTRHDEVEALGIEVVEHIESLTGRSRASS